MEQMTTALVTNFACSIGIAIVCIAVSVMATNANIISLYPAVMQFLSGSGQEDEATLISGVMGVVGTILAMTGNPAG